MKIFILICLVSVFGFSMMEDEYTEFLKENKKRHEIQKKTYRKFSCTPFQETGLLWGINKIIGGTPITINVQKTEMLSLIIDNNKIKKVGNDRFEDKNKRIYLKDYSYISSNLGYWYYDVNTIVIDKKDKTIWYNCLFIDEKEVIDLE